MHNVQPWILKCISPQQRNCFTVCFQHQHGHGTKENFTGDSPVSHLIHTSDRVSLESDSTTNNRIATSSIACSDCSTSHRHQNRRAIVHSLTHSIAAIAVLGFNMDSAVADAVDDRTFRRQMNEFRYEIQIPSNMNGPNQKPLKTHFDEANFKSTTVAGFEIGITVDPVRIDSLMDFGTPEEVAAKVVLAEVNRDGVLEVKLLDDPISGTVRLNDDTTTTYYQLNYVSDGKRGRKRYIAKFYIQNHMLLALTAQCKDDTYESVQLDMNEAVSSFQVV
jgi:PsbP